MKKFLIIAIVIIAALICLNMHNILNLNTNDENKEILVPQENYEENLTTEIVLYFLDNNNSIISETREVEIKNLMVSPYKYILELLKSEETTENRKNILKKEGQILSCELNGSILNIKVNNDFGNLYGENIPILKQILKNTVCQFKEITDIKIETEDGEEL